MDKLDARHLYILSKLQVVPGSPVGGATSLWDRNPIVTHGNYTFRARPPVGSFRGGIRSLAPRVLIKCTSVELIKKKNDIFNRLASRAAVLAKSANNPLAPSPPRPLTSFTSEPYPIPAK